MAGSAFDDLNECLMEDILCDMADNFFGRRKGIDDKRDLLDRYADSCREKADAAIRRAGCLNALLPDSADGVAERFYAAIGVRDAEPLINAGAAFDTVPDRMPFALTARGRFTALVEWAYDRTARACRAYLHGPPDDEPGPDEGEIEGYYALVERMVELINEEIRKVNTDMSPAGMLQRVRRLDVEGDQKARIAGSVYAGYDSGMNRGLQLQPVDFESFQLPKLPELLPLESVSGSIDRFCRDLHDAHKETTRKTLSEVRRRIAAGG